MPRATNVNVGLFKRNLHALEQLLRHHDRHRYPQTVAALARLRAAVELEFPRRPISDSSRKRKFGRLSVDSRKYYFKARRLKTEVDDLKQKLAKITQTKEAVDGHFRISKETAVRICLSSPVGSSGRGKAQSFQDVAAFGTADVKTVGRTTISRVRDAWVEMYKPMVYKAAADRVAAATGAAKKAKAEFVPVFLLHVQDEADIRLRSSGRLDSIAIPRRSRASKVQQNVVELGLVDGSMEIPTEIEALGDKTAATLATCFENLVRLISARVLGQQPQAHPEVWLVHIIVGDGIATNESAAKSLWSLVKQRPLGPGIRYLLCTLKCGTHQAGLAAKNAVAGRAAEAAGGTLHEHVCATCTRLYKYIICDYFDDLAFAAHEYVSRFLEVLPPSSADPAATGATAGMQALYTKRVIPDEMVALWNNGLCRLCHVVRHGQSPVDERPGLVVAFTRWIVRHLLQVDGSPTLSRFFTFREKMDGMLLISISQAFNYYLFVTYFKFQQ